MAYVRYLFIAVQRLSRTSRYYPEGILKSSVHSVLFGVRLLYYSQSMVVLSVSGRPVEDHCMFALQTTAYVRCFSVHPVLKDRGVHPSTLVYVRSRSLISQNALLADPSDSKSKLTL
jgi:hypothetical protein